MAPINNNFINVARFVVNVGITIVITTPITYMTGRSIAKLTGGSDPSFAGIAIQQTFTAVLTRATKMTYNSLPLNIKRHLPFSEFEPVLFSMCVGEIIGEKIANYVGYHAPFYLLPLGYGSLLVVKTLIK